ncbi:complement C3-like [Lineus longissimus]|uniref:complement C3-like n=1 Tax=Lineus longissimus TaxID=88925 RepID=UPI002B4C25FB
MLLFRALGALFAATLVAAQGPTIFVVFPNLMRFDSLEKVMIDYSGGGAPVPCIVSLQNYPDRDKTFSVKNVMVAPGTQTLAYVMTRLTDLVRGSLSTLNYVFVKVQCNPLNFNREAVVLLTGTKGYLFLQTDKPIYKPKEDVAIRAISLNPDLLPANTNFTMDILNPNQTIFKRFEGNAMKGFFSKKVKLPDVTILGNWSVRASYKNKFQPQALTSGVAFEVKEYVLPTFSVGIKTPDYILRSDIEVQVTVKANYVYKEEVKGRVTIVFSLVKKDGSSHTIAIKTLGDFDGEKTVALDKAEFRDKWFPDVGSRLVVEATVTEEASGKQETNSDSSAMFVNSPYVVSFDRTTKYFKPGLPYNLKLSLRYASGEVAAHVDMQVSATAKQTGRNDRVNVFRNDAESERFKTDEEGWRLITLDVPTNTEDLRIKVETDDPDIEATEQAEREITLKPQSTSRNNFLSIQLINNPSRIPVDRKLKIRVDFTENVNKHVSFMVLARGKVVSIHSMAVNGLSKHENIDITPQMAPRARLVVYYVSSGNPAEVIADSLVMDVSKTCEEELELSHALDDGEDYRPGENVQLTIKSADDSWVSILGVDKAVYLLSERDILSRDRMFNTIMDLDLGCGPGSGRNVGEVFRDAGLYVLTNKVNVATPRRLSPECKQKIRKRRAVERVRRGVNSNDRIIAALNRYSGGNRACCEAGFEQQVQGDQRSCVAIAQAKGYVHAGCKNAFLHCCRLEKNANTPRGRSGADDEEDINENDLDIETREDFPETWINELFEMRGDTDTLVRELPDSITTWVISGVSVSESAGMCVAKPINVTAKKEFFVHADLPYAAVRGEQLEVKATVYNFGRNRITTNVWMKADRSKLCYAGNNNGRTNKQRIVLEPKTGKKVTFPVVPLQVGDIDISVTAITQFSGDEVVRKLKSEAEGVTRYASFSTRLDPEGKMGGSGSGDGSAKVAIDIPNKRQTIEIPLKFPADAIPGTKICSVSISGSLLGPMVPSQDLNMASKIRQPTGCGEQTMIYMGPLVYTTRYMLRTNTLTGQLEQTAYKHILSGFRRELTYKHPDGSYAAWQKRSSSAWLTAFVAKVFCQASQFPNVGKEVAPHAVAAIKWLLANAQRADGSFYDPQRVIHADMFGQNLKNPVTFTAFVVESISKCGAVDGIDITSGNIAIKLRSAVDFLVRNRNSQNKPYEQAILTYALALQNNPHRHAANLKLRGMSNMDPVTGMRYWNPDGTVIPENTTPAWYKVKPSASAIETASYALLAQLVIGGGAEDYFQYSGPIASWLIRQRTKTGAFVSTTDTVIGLEALSDYALSADSRCDLNMAVRVILGKDKNQNFQLRKANAYNPYTITEDLPIDGKLFMEATGTGIGQVQVECQFNSPERKGEVCTFNLNVTSEEGEAPVEELNNEIAQVQVDRKAGIQRGDVGAAVKKFVNEINIEFSYIGTGPKVGMSILDVTLFSGFSPVLIDLIDLVRKGKIDRYEVASSTVLMYIGEVKKGVPTTVTFRATQDQIVKDVQPAAVKLYDYYEPDQHYCTKFYHPKQNSPLLATICDKNDEGRKVCQCAASACTDFWGFKLPGKGRPHLKTKVELENDACNIYEYAVKINAGPTEISGVLSKMEATVELNIKAGTIVYSNNDKIEFVWNEKCENPSFTAGTSYLVMGKDGAEYVDQNGRGAMRYVLDSTSHVVKWYGAQDKPRYNRALNTFANKLIQEGCGQ